MNPILAQNVIPGNVWNPIPGKDSIAVFILNPILAGFSMDMAIFIQSPAGFR